MDIKNDSIIQKNTENYNKGKRKSEYFVSYGCNLKEQFYRIFRYCQFYDSENSEYYYGQAYMLQLMNRLEEALENYDSAIQKNPENSVYQNGKAVVLYNMNRFEEALEYYDQAIQKNPDEAKYYNNKAISLVKMNRFEEALEYYDSAIQKNPENSVYYNGKADVLFVIK